MDSPGERILRAVSASVNGGFVPKNELFRLLDAFEHDAQEKGFADMKGLLAYCRNSACSIGRILLGMFRVRDKSARACSDALCTALQLTNFWQDFSRDIPRGRLCLPLREARGFGVPVQPGKVRADQGFERLLSFLVGQTRALYEKADSFPALVPASLARQVRLTQAGGQLILSRVEKLGRQVLETRPRLSWTDGPGLLLRAFL